MSKIKEMYQFLAKLSCWDLLFIHFEICKLIIETVDVKNPSNDQGDTPLSLATQSGHNEVCKLFTKRKKSGLNNIQKSKVAKK